MNIKDLMSGIGVVIDDSYRKVNDSDDKIFELVKNIEGEWEMPLYKDHRIPSENICNSLLQSASFILLDWKLWPSGASELERDGIKRNKQFLKKAKDYFVPAFIFTNESVDDVINALGSLYDKDNLGRNFIFVKGKGDLISSGISEGIMEWLRVNASVYTLKTWEHAFNKAKRKLFSSMYQKSPDWPKVFWNSYYEDGANPSSSITHLINDSLLGRIETNLFEATYLSSDDSTIPPSPDEIKSVMMAASFIQGDNLPENEIRAGDLFKQPKNKYWLNIRPDCDCIPRQNSRKTDGVELYCIEGESMKPSDIKKSYSNGHFNERVFESIVFSAHLSKTIRFKFQKLHKEKFSKIKSERVGRLIHPHITRIQQRYSSYLQRQGLPRIPKEAIREGDEE